MDKESGRYSVHISACKEEERLVYQKALERLGVRLKIYKDYKETLISERENLVQLLKQRLMTLHPRKYNKFLHMMQQYSKISQETGYFTGTKRAWNKVPEHKINQILELYKSGTTITKKIAEKVGVSIIKVQRVLKENNLGKRVIKTPEEKREEIAQFVKKNPKLTQKQIAEHFNVHESVVLRALKKYNIRTKARFKIPEEKIQKIIQMHNDNPAVKYLEIMKKVRVSSSVIRRVKIENNL
ncbi:MAG: hypothetical protein ABIB47_05260 [Candidatus Woesearchaeota archaeon]